VSPDIGLAPTAISRQRTVETALYGNAQLSVWQNWLRHPQNFWVRKALFQIHLWTGLGLGLYILVMSVTGCILIYRRSLSTWTSSQSKFVTISGQRMTVDELKQAAERLYPGFEAEAVFQSRNLSRPVEILLGQGTKRVERIFNPYNGADMGPTMGAGAKVLNWILNLHDNLLLPHEAGHRLNAAGGIALVLMTATGIVIWWPGSAKWRQSLGLEFKAVRKKWNWSLHSMLGIWFISFVFMWGFTGIYLAAPEVFDDVADYLDPNNGASRKPNFSDQFLYWLAQLHFGRFAGLTVEIIWTILGLVPLALFVTGAFMWWNRVLNPYLKRSAQRRSEMRPSNTPQPQSSLGD
jgi:uncharacterized iron-regulated membrane protein